MPPRVLAGCQRLVLRGDRLHPVGRILLFLFGLLGLHAAVAVAYAVYLLLRYPPDSEIWQLVLEGLLPRSWLMGQGVIQLAGVLAMALLLGRFLDREPAETMGLDLRRAGRDGVLGLALGLGAIAALVGAGLAGGWLALSRGTAGAGGFLRDAVALLLLAAVEEVAFRGYLLRAVAGWKGPVAGVVTTSVLFTLAHLANPGVGLLGLVNIMLAGVVFALAVERTGTLWLALGYHFAWNLAQGPLFGMPVSGMSWAGLLATATGGPPLLTGGAFGPEGGLLATAVLLLSLPLLWLMTRTPATVAVLSSTQRAALEARFAPLPHLHHSLEVGGDFFRDVVRALWRGRRGEVVLLLRRPGDGLVLHTKPFYPAGVYRLPSGGIEPGEMVMEAAAREAEEETGLALQSARPLGLVTYRLRAGRQRLFFHSWLVVADVAGQPTATAAGDEHISGFRWVELGALPGVAAELRSLAAEWRGWGRFRALAHDAAVRWLAERVEGHLPTRSDSRVGSD